MVKFCNEFLQWHCVYLQMCRWHFQKNCIKHTFHPWCIHVASMMLWSCCTLGRLISVSHPLWPPWYIELIKVTKFLPSLITITCVCLFVKTRALVFVCECMWTCLVMCSTQSCQTGFTVPLQWISADQFSNTVVRWAPSEGPTTIVTTWLHDATVHLPC